MNAIYDPYDDEIVDGEIVAYYDEDEHYIDYDQLDRQAHAQLDPVEERAIAHNVPTWIAGIEHPALRGILAAITNTVKTGVRHIGATIWAILKTLNASLPMPALLAVYAVIALMLVLLPLATISVLFAPDDPAVEAVIPEQPTSRSLDVPVAAAQQNPVIQAPTQMPATLAPAPDIQQQMLSFAERNRVDSTLSPVFTPTVRVWDDDLRRWSAESGLDVNLLATLMQITTCGNPSYLQGTNVGLFAVPLTEFANGEVFTNPDNSARRATDRLQLGLVLGNNDPAIALAYYVGGLQALDTDFSRWSQPTRDAFIHGRNLYQAATVNTSDTGAISEWLSSGGAMLCQPALAALDGV